ncbi:MAG: hypothetical protein WAZ18_07640, partial [Alphaproteobacteria bacterium]
MKSLITCLTRYPKAWPLYAMVLALAFGIGLYMALTAAMASQYAWSYKVLANIYLAGGVGAFLGLLAVGKTAAISVSRYFFQSFGALMVCAVIMVWIWPESWLVWGVFSFIKGLSHAYFYHGTRVLLVHKAKSADYGYLFSIKYFCLCLGSIVSPLLAAYVNTGSALGLYMSMYALIGMLGYAVNLSIKAKHVEYKVRYTLRK